MIGGTTIEESPNAILVESGDIAIMFGDSRLRYHGVPRILRSTKDPWNSFQPSEEQYVNLSAFIPELSCDTYPVTCKNLTDRDLWAPFSNYVNMSRININVRQVLTSDQTSLVS